MRKTGEKMSIDPRKIAYDIIYDVKYSKAYSNISLNKNLNKYKLDPRDKGFITELVYGTLSRLIYLDYIIEVYSSIKLSKMSKSVITVLEMAVYQIEFMDSVTDFAAVDESVKMIKKEDNRSTAFVNGILRNIIRKKQEINVDDIKELSKKLSIKYSVSEYIVKRFLKTYKEEFTVDLLEALNEKPELIIRKNNIKALDEDIVKLLEEDGVNIRPVSLIPDAYAVSGLKDIGNNEYFKKGFFAVQDISSMMAVRALDPKPGETVLDICSAPGGKAFYAADMMNNEGNIDAFDISEHKIGLLDGMASQLGINIIHSGVKDACIYDEELRDKYDRVLVDAPCSGFGIIRRKPEIRYKGYEDVKDLPKIQLTILLNASRYLKKGGRLVYSTCTIEKNENEKVAGEFLNQNSDFELDGEMQQLFPNTDNTDGFFIAVFKRKGNL